MSPVVRRGSDRYTALQDFQHNLPLLFQGSAFSTFSLPGGGPSLTNFRVQFYRGALQFQSLLINEMGPPVLLPAFFVVLRTERPFFPAPFFGYGYGGGRYFHHFSNYRDWESSRKTLATPPRMSAIVWFSMEFLICPAVCRKHHTSDLRVRAWTGKR